MDNEPDSENMPAAQTPAASLSTDVRIAYHAGPDSIGFSGREWKRGAAQTVTPDEWAAMQARGDFDEFNFTEEH